MFGIPGYDTYTASNTFAASCCVDEAVDWDGRIVDQFTYAGTVSVTTGGYLPPGASWSSEAVNGQTGSAVIVGASLRCSASGFAQTDLTARWLDPPPPPEPIPPLPPLPDEPYLIDRRPGYDLTFVTAGDSDPRKIARYLVTGSTLTVKYASGAWDDRESLSYVPPVPQLYSNSNS